MPLKQRTVQYSLNGHKLLDASKDAFYKWANRKNNVDLGTIGVDGELALIGENTFAQFVKFDRDGLEGTRFIHEITNDGGTYRTELTTVRKGNEGWVQADVYAPRDNARFSPPAIPRYLLEAADSNGINLLDGSMFNVYSPAPRSPKVDEIGRLLDESVNLSLRGQSVVIAGSDGTSNLNNWRESLEDILHPVQGLATFWLLDPESTKEFNQIVLPEFRVYPFSMHYFAPGVDTEEPSDSRHHRYFSSKEIVQDLRRFRGNRGFTGRRIYHLARSAALRNPLPVELKQADELLRQSSTDQIVASLQPAMPLRTRIKQESLFTLPEWAPIDQLEIDLWTSPKPPVPDRIKQQPKAKPSGGKNNGVLPVQEDLFGSVQEISHDEPSQEKLASSEGQKQAVDLKIAHAITLLSAEIGLPIEVETIDENYLMEIFAYAEQGLKANSIQEKLLKTRQNLDKVQQERDYAESLVEELYSELDDLESEASQERVRASNFWVKLQSSGNTDSDWSDPTVNYPVTITEVLDRFKELKFLQFTGDVKRAKILDDRDNSSAIARNCWTFLTSLNSYAEQWEFGYKGVQKYLNANITPANPTHHAPNESKSVRETEKYKKERLLPVPIDVDSSGLAYMYAHYRLSKTTGKAARLHYLDDMEKTGKIYIGHIGSHLTSNGTT